VLDLLSSSNEGSVHDRGISVLFHHFFTFFDQAGHSLALLSLGRNAEELECLVEPLDLTLGLLQMFLEGRLQLRMICCFDHPRQRLEDLTLGMIDVLKLVNQQVIQ
jgi:hypothetical protein